MDNLWTSKESCFEFALDVRYLQKRLDFVEFEEVNFVCTIWDIIGTCLQTSVDGGPCQNYCYYQFGSTEEWKAATHDSMTYGLLSEVHKGLHADHYIDGKVTKERCYLLLGR